MGRRDGVRHTLGADFPDGRSVTLSLDLAVVIATAVAAAGPSTAKRWVWALLPLTAAVMLDVRILSIGRDSLIRPSDTDKYVAVSSLLLFFMLIWIVAFPDPDYPCAFIKQLRRYCRGILFLIGLAFVSLETYRAFRLLSYPHTAGGWFA
jgi:hypothetical protein